MKNPYDDILNLPHHVSQNHPQMSMRDRAAQFSPFAALTGYEDAIDETGRLTEQRRELSEQEQAEINSCLTSIASKLNQQPKVRVEYFVPDAVKAGGAYVTETGCAKKLSLAERTITLNTGTVIGMDDIAQISEF